MLLGLTGLYASGKSTLVTLLVDQGFTKIDLDVLGHQALEVHHEALVKLFGTEILSEQGKIDRKILGSLVFADEKKLKNLEAISHPWMVSQVKRIIHKPGDYVVDGALVVPMGLDQLCDALIWVSSPVFQRLFRARRRDQLPFRELFRRFRSQKKIPSQYASSTADKYTISTFTGENSAKEKLLALVEKLRRKK